MKRNILVIGVLVVTLIIVVGLVANHYKVPSQTGNVITDQANRKVVVPDHVERIVSLWPEATRVIIALNSGDKLVGVSKFDKRDPIMLKIYPRLKDLPDLGTSTQPNIEEIIKLKPNVIFMDARTGSIADEVQEKTGIPVVCVRINLPPEGKFSYDLITIIGGVIGKGERAEEVKKFLEDKLSIVESKVADIPEEERVKGYIAFARDPLVTNGLRDPLERAGVINVAYNPKAVWYNINIEQLIAWNPDVIYVHAFHKTIGNYTIEQILNDPKWQKVKAVKEGRVYNAIVGLNGWYPEMTVINIMEIAKSAYPEMFKDLDILKEGDEIYKFIYGVDNFFTKFAQEWDLYTG